MEAFKNAEVIHIHAFTSDSCIAYQRFQAFWCGWRIRCVNCGVDTKRLMGFRKRIISKTY